MHIQVTKRDGRREPLDLEKMHRVVEWACEGLPGVSPSEVELKSQISFFNNMKTGEIQETLIKAAADLISEESPNYQYVAGRLIAYHLRKEVYGRFEPTRLYDHVKRVVSLGFYDSELLELYTEEEYDQIERWIDHRRDFQLTYAAMEQMRGKYLVKNRHTKQFYETPQILYALVSMTLFANEDRSSRLRQVRSYYESISTHEISLPTPIMSGVRTPERQFSSCVLIESNDTLNSMASVSHATMLYVAQRAGIGLGAGKIRCVDDPVAGGKKTHTGKIPFYRIFQSAVKSCSQGGVRGGAATLNYVLWDREALDLLVLKNNKGTEFSRLRGLDYCVQLNRVMYERLLQNGNISLMSPYDIPEAYDAYFTDVDRFRELYEKAEKNPRIKKVVVPAVELFGTLMHERKSTGRIYIMNVDHCNTHGPFIEKLAPIKMTNLCTEVTLPTKPFETIEDPEAEIALCVLSAYNMGKFQTSAEMRKTLRKAVRALDNLLDYQEYLVPPAENATKKRRSLGVGIINFAYWLARSGLSYQHITPAGLQKIHEFAEEWSYYLIEASIDLAEEKGPCPGWQETKYGQGIFPIDTYKREVDELVAPVYKMNWDYLREKVKRVGIRNSTLMAFMPSETSAQIANATSGIDPVPAIVTVKGSKDGALPQVVPGPKSLWKSYDLQWDQQSPEGYLKIMAVWQKFLDQAISINTNYNPKFYPEEQIPESELFKHLIMFYKYGGKNLYYFNTLDGAGEIDVHAESLPQQENEEDDDCEGCKI